MANDKSTAATFPDEEPTFKLTLEVKEGYKTIWEVSIDDGSVRTYRAVADNETGKQEGYDIFWKAFKNNECARERLWDVQDKITAIIQSCCPDELTEDEEPEPENLVDYTKMSDKEWLRRSGFVEDDEEHEDSEAYSEDEEDEEELTEDEEDEEELTEDEEPEPEMKEVFRDKKAHAWATFCGGIKQAVRSPLDMTVIGTIKGTKVIPLPSEDKYDEYYEDSEAFSEDEEEEKKTETVYIEDATGQKTIWTVTVDDCKVTTYHGLIGADGQLRVDLYTRSMKLDDADTANELININRAKIRTVMDFIEESGPPRISKTDIERYKADEPSHAKFLADPIKPELCTVPGIGPDDSYGLKELGITTTWQLIGKFCLMNRDVEKFGLWIASVKGVLLAASTITRAIAEKTALMFGDL